MKLRRVVCLAVATTRIGVRAIRFALRVLLALDKISVMKHCKTFFVGIALTAVLLSNITANTQPQSPGLGLTPVSDEAAALELKIARTEVERSGLLNKWTPASNIVMAANKKLSALRAQLSALRPNNPSVSAQTKQKAIREKIAQLQTVREYLATQSADKTLDAERKSVTNYLSVLRKDLAPRSLPSSDAPARI